MARGRAHGLHPRWCALAARSPRSPPPAPPSRRGTGARSARYVPSSSTTAATRRRSPRSRRSPAACPACRTGAPRADGLRPAGRALAAVLDALRRPGRRTAASSAPAATRATGRSCSTRLARRRARSAAVYSQHSRRGALPGQRDPDVAAGAPARLPRDGSHAAYFVPGVRDRIVARTRTTRPTGRGRACGRGSSAITADSPPWMTLPRAVGRRATRAGSPARRTRPRGPAFQPGDRWRDPDALGRSGAARARARTATRCGECDQAARPRSPAALAAERARCSRSVYGWRRSRRATAPEDADADARATTPRPAGR